MSINSGVPNHHDQAITPTIYLGVQSGNPGPASTPGQYLKVFATGQASPAGGDKAIPLPTTQTLAAAGIVPTAHQLLSSVHSAAYEANGSLESDPTILAGVSAGSPASGTPAPPNPLPTVEGSTSAAASNGQQPSVTTAFSSTGWNVISSV